MNYSYSAKAKIQCVWLLLATLLAGSGCAGLFAEPDPNLGSQDAAIATEIKTELIKSKDLNAAPVKVEVTKGVAQLTGFVDTKAKKRHASAIAKNVSGVSKVNNEIVVK